MESKDFVWLKLYRKMLDWEWIDCPEMVSLWINILLRAATYTHKEHGVTVKRGQLVTSRAQLAKDCGLSERTVRTCLSRLKSSSQVTIKTTNRTTSITICKYDCYQESAPINRPAERPAERPRNDQQTTSKTGAIPISSSSKSKHILTERQNKERNSLYERVKKEDSQGSLLSLRKQQFYDSLRPYQDIKGGKYSGTMLHDFFAYWSEPNRSQTKMRFELEKTWDLSLRLSNWARREKTPSSPKTTTKINDSVNEQWGR